MKTFGDLVSKVLAGVLGVFLLSSPAFASFEGGLSDGDEFLKSSVARDSIHRALGDKYDAFQKNFKIVARPVLLKDGGVFVDAWRGNGVADDLNAPFENAAAYVHYPDGRIFVAYFNKDAGVIHYYDDDGSDPSRMHPAIKVWSEPFFPRIERIERQSYVIRLKNLSRGVDDDIREIARMIWGENVSSGLNMSDEVQDVIRKTVDEITTCSVRSAFVPQYQIPIPLGVLAVLRDYAKNVALNMKDIVQGRRYRFCVVNSASARRRELDLANLGI